MSSINELKLLPESLLLAYWLMIEFILVLLAEFLPLALVSISSRIPASILERMTWFHVTTIAPLAFLACLVLLGNG